MSMYQELSIPFLSAFERAIGIRRKSILSAIDAEAREKGTGRAVIDKISFDSQMAKLFESIPEKYKPAVDWKIKQAISEARDKFMHETRKNCL